MRAGGWCCLAWVCSHSALLLALWWAGRAGLGCMFESSGPPNNPKTQALCRWNQDLTWYKCIEYLAAALIRSLPSGQDRLIKIQVWGQQPPVYCLPFGSREGSQICNPRKGQGDRESPGEAPEEAGALGQHGEMVEGEYSGCKTTKPGLNKGCKRSMNHGNGINLKLYFQGGILVVITVCFYQIITSCRDF